MNGLVEAIVHNDVPNAADGDEKRHDPRHPSESHESCQESTCGVNVAPAEFPPLASGDGGSNDPQDEQEQYYDQFAAEG